MKIMIGQGSCGIATGAKKTQAAFEKEIADRNLNVELDCTGCVGTCYLEPIVDVYSDDGAMTRYVRVQPDRVKRIVEEHLVGRGRQTVSGQTAENCSASLRTDQSGKD